MSPFGHGRSDPKPPGKPDGRKERARARATTGPMRNPTAAEPVVGTSAGADGRWTAREPVAWRDDAGGGCWQGGVAWDMARPRDAARPLAGGGAEHGGGDPAAAEASAGGGGGGRAGWSVRGGADPGGPGGGSGGAAGGPAQGPGVPVVRAAAREDGSSRQRRAGLVWSDRTAAAVSAPEPGGRSSETTAVGAAWVEPEPGHPAPTT